YEGEFTLIGTPDEDYHGDPAAVAISAAEIDYLAGAVSEYLRQPVRPADVVWSYSGVRPLFDDGASAAQEATRDYVLQTAGDAETGVVLHVFGGKLTTYRRLSEAALERIEAVLGAKGPAWTRDARLPGGDFPVTGFEAQADRLAAAFPRLPRALLRRLCRQYGTRVAQVLGDARETDELGEHFGAGLYAREVDYLRAQEWARTAEDVLWRRTKLGLRTTPEENGRLAAYMAARVGSGETTQ